MSTNCIQCIVKKRTGPDLLCDECRTPAGSCLICGELRQFSIWSGSAGVCLECREAARRRSTPPTQSKPCNYCEGTGSVETAPCVSVVCPLCKGERSLPTPPTQSQEGETEVDTAHKQFHAQDEYAHHPGVSLEFARTLHSRLTAAQRENDRLRSEVALIEWQNQEKLTVTWNHLHGAFIVQGVNQVVGNMGRGPTVIEALRTARAATEEGKRG